MPEFHNKHINVTKTIMDHFFFGNKNVMNKIMNTYNNIKELLQKCDCYSCEEILYQQILTNDISIKRFMCSYGYFDKDNYISIFN